MTVKGIPTITRPSDMSRRTLVVDCQDSVGIVRAVTPKAAEPKTKEYTEPGYGPRNGGAKQNNGKKGANSRAVALLPAVATKPNGNGYDASKDKALQSSADWSKVADSYDPTCGMKPTAEWIDDFMALMREGARYYAVVDWGVFGKNHQRWLANAERTIKPVRVCYKCRKEITGDKPAFCWSVDRHLYCGKCYGELPPPPKPVEVKPIEVQPVTVKPIKVDPLIKELQATQLVMAQALQDKAEVKPAIDKSQLTHDTPRREFHALETALGQLDWQQHRHEIEARTYHWSGGWGRKVEVKEAKVEAPQEKRAA